MARGRLPKWLTRDDPFSPDLFGRAFHDGPAPPLVAADIFLFGSSRSLDATSRLQANAAAETVRLDAGLTVAPRFVELLPSVVPALRQSADPGTNSVVQPGPVGAGEYAGGHQVTVSLGGGLDMRLFSPVSGRPFADGTESAQYAILYSEDFQSSLVMNTLTKELLTGGAGDWPMLGQGKNDSIELAGDFSGGFTLPGQPFGIDQIIATSGGQYNLDVTDDHVAPGERLTVNAMPLANGDRFIFDGSAERDGSFLFLGSGGNDIFIGGEGDDVIRGFGGADILRGGGGNDTFAYTGARESTGSNHDILADFDPAEDRIDLLGTVTGFADAIEMGQLSTETFDDDLAAALAALGAGQAVWFSPDSGDQAGKVFLIVDANGVEGYQEGEDYVFAVEGADLAYLSGYTDFFV